MQQVLLASRIFTGTDWLEHHAVVVREGRIESVVPRAAISAELEVRAVEGWLVPAWVDVQVYGAGGKLFSAYPEAATLELMHRSFAASGTACFLPTVATHTPEVMRQCIDAVRTYRASGGKGVAGLHLEGPWLNAARKGAHVAGWIHAPALEEVRDLLDDGQDVIKMITVAPEVCPDAVIELILSRGIVLSAGHSNATYAQAMQSFDKGIAAVTHLYNAMSPLHHREPGLVGAAFNHPRVRASIIPDGRHVAYEALSLAKKIMGPRLFAITDAVTETNAGPYQHQLAGEIYESGGTLSGSALTMHRAFVNLVTKAGIAMEEALRMCSLYPAEVLGCDGHYGKIAPGSAAQFLVLDEQLAIVETIL